MKQYVYTILIIMSVGIFGYGMMMRHAITFFPLSAYTTQGPTNPPPVIPVTEPFPSSQTSAPKPTPKPTPQTPPQAAGTFTLAQVATHATEANCYSAINGVVYNLTAWINKHPGGDRAILSICGKDGSAAFNGQHAGSTRVENILAGYEVGILIK